MVVKVNTDEDVYFRQLLEILSSLPPIKDLSNREKDILSIILRYNWKYREFPEEEKKKIMFGRLMRDTAAKELSIKPHTVRTVLGSLKRKSFIEEDDIANWLKKFNYGDSFEFKFKI